MISTENQVYRVTYEAFSKFSNNLVQCRSLEEVAACFRLNLKYLFNCHAFHAIYRRNGTLLKIVTTRSNTGFSFIGEEDLTALEHELFAKKIPFHKPAANHSHWLQTTLAAEEQPELWGWNFSNNNDRQIIVTVLAGTSKKFSKKDIPIVKLVSETLESKLLELLLFKELDDKNAIINKIIEDQKEIIAERTHELELKNKRLLEISVLNAHSVREPLSRIMGLVSLFEILSPEAIEEEVIPHLKTSASNLDDALKEVILKATADLKHLKA